MTFLSDLTKNIAPLTCRFWAGQEEYEEESVDDEEREPDVEFAPGGTK
jgi:hypothetical protein